MISVSLETVGIVEGLPELGVGVEGEGEASPGEIEVACKPYA